MTTRHVDEPPRMDVTLGQVLRIAGLLILLTPVVLGGAAMALWIVWQIVAFIVLVVSA